MAKKQKVILAQSANFVAKHMNEFNHSRVFIDQKKALKRGYDKHKKGRYSAEDLPFLYLKI